MSDAIRDAVYIRAGSNSMPQPGVAALICDADGLLKTLDSSGNRIPLSALAPAQKALGRAVQLCGSTMVKVLGTDFDNDQWYRLAVISTGAGPQSTTESGGVINLTTGATASSQIAVLPHGTTTVLIGNPQTSLWYLRFRVKWTSAVDAQGATIVGLCTAAVTGPIVRFGMRGSQSTANFSCSTTDNAASDQATSTTTIAQDQTAYHTVEIWNDGTNINFAYDETPVFSTAKANVGTNAVAPAVIGTNGTTATARTMNADSVYVVLPEN